MKPDPLASLAPLFAAERERRIGALEAAARSLARVRGGRARAALLEAMARDAHALKGAAALETRGQLADLVNAFEEQLGPRSRALADPGHWAALLSTLAAIRQLSERGVHRTPPNRRG